MSWTEEKPKKDGYYWFRSTGMDSAKIIRVKSGLMFAGLWIFEVTDFAKGEFIGPLKEQ